MELLKHRCMAYVLLLLCQCSGYFVTGMLISDNSVAYLIILIGYTLMWRALLGFKCPRDKGPRAFKSC